MGLMELMGPIGLILNLQFHRWSVSAKLGGVKAAESDETSGIAASAVGEGSFLQHVCALGQTIEEIVCVGITPGQNIDFEDNLNHRQLFAQALHLLNQGERYWLEDEEIAQLIRENEPYQKLNDLVEMIGETFRKPKAGEGRWWTLKEISEHLANSYANYDSKTTYVKLGKALSDQSFDFETERKSSGHYYKLVER